MYYQKINYLGEYPDLEALWAHYPEGGREGDWAHVDGEPRYWDRYKVRWSAGDEESRGRETTTISGDCVVGGDLVVGGTISHAGVRTAFKGFFENVLSLLTACGSPLVGDWAYVAEGDTTYLYYCNGAGTWTQGEAVDMSDVSDLTARVSALEHAYRRRIYRYFADEVFTENGLMRANGTVSTNSAYLHTPPLGVADVEQFLLHSKLASESATSFFPIVVWLNAAGTAVGYVNCTAGEGDYVLTPPADAHSAVFNVLTTFVRQTDSMVCHADIISAMPFACRIYISPEGSDQNDGLSKDSPVQTLRRANSLLAPDGELVMLAGDYYDLPLDLSNYGKIVGDGCVRCISGYRIAAAEAVAGYSRVLSATIAKPPTRGTYLWQHDVADTATLIASDEVHPEQQGRIHRLPSTRLYPAASIADIEASTDVLKWYVSGTTLYFSKADGTDLASHPVVLPRRTIVGSALCTIDVRNVAFLYSSLLLRGLHGLLENVSVGMVNATGALRYDGASDFLLRRCEAYGCSNDGFNGHGTVENPSDIVLDCCWSHDNCDDGESCHEHCRVRAHGGLYEYNGSGCTPASGGRAAYYGVMARKNLPDHLWTGSAREGTGFSAQGAAPSGAETAMHCHCCYATANRIGIRTTLTTGTQAIGCISEGNGTDYAGDVARI